MQLLTFKQFTDWVAKQYPNNSVLVMDVRLASIDSSGQVIPDAQQGGGQGYYQLSMWRIVQGHAVDSPDTLPWVVRVHDWINDGWDQDGKQWLFPEEVDAGKR